MTTNTTKNVDTKVDIFLTAGLQASLLSDVAGSGVHQL
jgi:hypothetical protein